MSWPIYRPISQGFLFYFRLQNLFYLFLSLTYKCLLWFLPKISLTLFNISHFKVTSFPFPLLLKFLFQYFLSLFVRSPLIRLNIFLQHEMIEVTIQGKILQLFMLFGEMVFSFNSLRFIHNIKILNQLKLLLFMIPFNLFFNIPIFSSSFPGISLANYSWINLIFINNSFLFFYNCPILVIHSILSIFLGLLI